MTTAFWIAALGLLEPTPGWTPVAEHPEPVVESHWYGGPAVGADVVASVVTVIGLAKPDHAAIIPGGIIFGLGAPANHLAHGHPGRAAISLAARALAGALVWPALRDHILICDAPTCYNAEGPLALTALFMAGVMVADDALLAREMVTRPAPQTTMLSPGVLAGPGSALVSLSGRF
ncbi:MAG TPA: hypothetical protein VKQ32_27355 [Polyangia bacterium]|nr:hypothetical protein [Polyangia bacterium]